MVLMVIIKASLFYNNEINVDEHYVYAKDRYTYFKTLFVFSSKDIVCMSSRKHACIILTPLNPTFI